MAERIKVVQNSIKIKKRPAFKLVRLNQQLFDKIYKKWRDETQFDSFIGDPYHKSYENIVKYGYKAIPYIITKLKEEPSLIFVALIRITGETPIKEENRGNVKKMSEDWIEWWEKKNNTRKS
jgi:hypothetical protein